jgi:transposase
VKALACNGPPKYQRAAAGSVADEAEPRIRELLAAYPRMPATVIAERIGWSYSIRTLSERVRELRPVYLAPDPGLDQADCQLASTTSLMRLSVIVMSRMLLPSPAGVNW